MCDMDGDGVWGGWFRRETCCGIFVNSVSKQRTDEKEEKRGEGELLLLMKI